MKAASTEAAVVIRGAHSYEPMHDLDQLPHSYGE